MDIQFIRLYDHAKLEDGDSYQMVESSAFFEAYRHVLEGLKEVTPADLPMQVTDVNFLPFYKYIFLRLKCSYLVVIYIMLSSQAEGQKQRKYFHFKLYLTSQVIGGLATV